MNSPLGALAFYVFFSFFFFCFEVSGTLSYHNWSNYEPQLRVITGPGFQFSGDTFFSLFPTVQAESSFLVCSIGC